METAKKVTEEQLTAIKTQNAEMQRLLTQIGLAENQKHHLLHEYAGLIKDIEEFKGKLEEEYGAVNIDLDTGIYTDIPKQEEKK